MIEKDFIQGQIRKLQKDREDGVKHNRILAVMLGSYGEVVNILCSLAIHHELKQQISQQKTITLDKTISSEPNTHNRFFSLDDGKTLF